MSLLEDIFLQDEANEAQELERIIEGDEFDERPRSDSDDNSEKEDEAEEDKRRVDPQTVKAKRIVKNPRFILNPARLTGPRGIQVIPDHFKDFKFKGKGHEKHDLDLVLKKLEHWAYRLYPKFQFADCLKKIETLGKKKPVMVHLTKIRSDQFLSEDTVVQKDSSDEENVAVQPEEDEFDRLLQQQIEIARSTPAPNSVKKTGFDEVNRSFNALAASSPSMSDEQRERMLRSKRLAEEKRLAKLKNAANNTTHDNLTVDLTNLSNMDSNNKIANIVNNHIDLTNVNDYNEINSTTAKEKTSNIMISDEESSNSNNDVRQNVNIIGNSVKDVDNNVFKRRVNRSNVIDSSDDENITMSESFNANNDKPNENCSLDDDENKHKEQTQPNVIDSSDDEGITNNEPVRNKHTNIYKSTNDIDIENANKINDLDSSDDEDVIMNESIRVDIHMNVNKATNDPVSNDRANKVKNAIDTNAVSFNTDKIIINKSIENDSHYCSNSGTEADDGVMNEPKEPGDVSNIRNKIFDIIEGSDRENNCKNKSIDKNDREKINIADHNSDSTNKCDNLIDYNKGNFINEISVNTVSKSFSDVQSPNKEYTTRVDNYQDKNIERNEFIENKEDEFILNTELTNNISDKNLEKNNKTVSLSKNNVIDIDKELMDVDFDDDF